MAPCWPDGASTSGNAALTQVLTQLNAYLATVVSSRPSGPVTVDTLSTSSTTPTITGTATLAAGEQLSVVIEGVQYTTSSTPAVVRDGSGWSLTLASPLPVGTYSVTATITDADGFTLSDATTDELVIRTPRQALTVGGSFTAHNRTYDGTTAATGTTSGLTLVGVSAPDVVTVANVTLAFDSAAAGSDRTVRITGLTLGGADTARYDVSLACAPMATANITARPLTITGITASDRAYDGTTTATLAGTAAYAGLASGESFAVAGTPSATFATADVDTSKAVTVTGYAAPSANYTVTQPTGLTASITPRALTIGGTFTAADKRYDGTTTATIATNALSLVGVVGEDDVALTGLTAAFADAAVGAAKPVALGAASLTGAAAGNYALSLAGAPATTASITEATPPSAPRNLAATPADGSIALTWAAPATAGCTAVSGYVVEYSTDAGQSWTRVALATPSPTATRLQGLVNNVPHRVRVAAVNECGTGAFSATVGPVVPLGPVVDGSGRSPSSSPGAAATTTAGITRLVTPEIVQDTIVRLVAGEFTLRLVARDPSGVAAPVELARPLELEHGGRAAVDGSGFEPGSFVTIYLHAANGESQLLGSEEVRPDGRFAVATPIPGDLPAGAYSLQVNGIDPVAGLRAVALGLEVVPPPADLVLTSVPDQASPMAGDTITITLTVTNQGAGPAIDVLIPRAFDEPGFTVVRATPQVGTYDEGTQTWTIDRIEPGAHARMLLTVVVRPPADFPESTP